MNKPASNHPSSHAAHSPAEPRRSFLKEFLAVVVGGAITLVPAVTGLAFLMNPLLKSRKKSTTGDEGEQFRMVGTTTGLEGGDEPQMFQVMGVKKDAWTTYPETALGAIYIQKKDDGSLSCFNAQCPHLGCTVNYKPDAQAYLCPCHDSSFTQDGVRSNDIPPRDMDTLDVEIRNGNELWVRFQNFRPGTSDKIPV